MALHSQEDAKGCIATLGSRPDNTTSPNWTWSRPDDILPCGAGHGNSGFDGDLGSPQDEEIGDLTLTRGVSNVSGASSQSLLQPLGNEAHFGTHTWHNSSANPQLAPSRATLATTNREGRHACFRCGKTFGRLSDLRRHARRYSSPTLLCGFEACQKRFNRHDKLREHRRKKHRITVSTI
jgi:predicted RNA-binding Zn-ribbon protein involved in translation (DUF1610 family)